MTGSRTFLAAALLALAWAGEAAAAGSAANPGGPAASRGAMARSTAAVDRIAQRVAACTGCHGAQGQATAHGYFPRIAGKPAGYLHNQLINFREGRRQQALMTALVEHLGDDYLREMAGHFASLDLPYPPPQAQPMTEPMRRRGEQLVREGDAARRIPACAGCHGAALTGVAPAIPGLLGLPRDYLAGQFGAWKTGQRRATAPDCMAQISTALTADDVAAVSTWLAAQPVPQPAKPAATLPARLALPCGSVPP